MPTSSSCRGMVAFGHLEGPSGPPDPTPYPYPLHRVKKQKKIPPFFVIGGPPPPSPPYPLHRVKKKFFYFYFFYPHFFYRGPHPIPPIAAPLTPCTEFIFFYFFFVAILDFTDVNNVTEGREGRDQAWFFMWIQIMSMLLFNKLNKQINYSVQFAFPNSPNVDWNTNCFDKDIELLIMVVFCGSSLC